MCKQDAKSTFSGSFLRASHTHTKAAALQVQEVAYVDRSFPSQQASCGYLPTPFSTPLFSETPHVKYFSAWTQSSSHSILQGALEVGQLLDDLVLR